jgi:hypothetical protein
MMLVRIRELTNNLFVPVALTAVIYGVFLFARLAAHDNEPSYFVVAGSNYYDRVSADSTLRSIRQGDGYDGQFYYRLAIDPFSSKSTDHGVSFDAPAYRQQRILYPLLAWAASAGKADRVPAALIAVNYVGLCAIAWLGALLAIDLDRHPLWGVAFSLYPGFIFTLSRDLTEIVSSAFLLAGLLLARRSRPGVSATCLSLAALARETTLVLPIGLLLTAIFDPAVRSGRWRRAGYYAIPLVLYTAWRSYLHVKWAGSVDVRVLGGAIGVPFSGVTHLLYRAFNAPDRLSIVWFAEVCLLGILASRALQLFYRRKDFVAETIALILSIALVASLTPKYWAEDQAFLRVTTEMFFLGFVGLLLDRTRTSLMPWFVLIGLAAFTFRWRVEW